MMEPPAERLTVEAGKGSAFLQWKGTDACLDLYCACGSQRHFDGFSARQLTCGNCGQTWELPHMLMLRAATPEVPPPGGEFLSDGPSLPELDAYGGYADERRCDEEG
jgi:hypothetical protein